MFNDWLIRSPCETKKRRIFVNFNVKFLVYCVAQAIAPIFIHVMILESCKRKITASGLHCVAQLHNEDFVSISAKLSQYFTL